MQVCGGYRWFGLAWLPVVCENGSACFSDFVLFRSSLPFQLFWRFHLGGFACLGHFVLLFRILVYAATRAEGIKT